MRKRVLNRLDIEAATFGGSREHAFHARDHQLVAEARFGAHARGGAQVAPQAGIRDQLFDGHA
jgi:hypothetical protein